MSTRSALATVLLVQAVLSPLVVIVPSTAMLWFIAVFLSAMGALQWPIVEHFLEIVDQRAHHPAAPARHLASCLRLRRFIHELQSEALRARGVGETGARDVATAANTGHGGGVDCAAVDGSEGVSLSVKCFDPSYSAQNTVLVARVDGRNARGGTTSCGDEEG